jgi:SAM-dependent methyltransferase
MPVRVCNICGSNRFTLGPGQRTSDTHVPPYCVGCGSLERHRALRSMYMRLHEAIRFADFDVLQISDDSAVLRSWFRTITVSIYGGENSVDVQDAPYADGTFDLIICNHVLEHVADDQKAIQELVRLLRPEGILQLGIPDPVRRAATDDWGFPRREDHGHFRLYGMDVLKMFRRLPVLCFLVTVRFADPVTGMEDIYFLFTRSEQSALTLSRALPEAAVEKIEGDGRQHVIGKRNTPLRALTRIATDQSTFQPSSEYSRYVIDGEHKSIPGWVTDGALTVTSCLAALQDEMGAGGAVCEIGVHHGRFFIALANMVPKATALAVDVFDDQVANVDHSGCGDLSKFLSNVARWAANPDRVRTLQADSLTITPEMLTRNLDQSRIRLFSIDGSHTARHVQNDLVLAENTLAAHGVVIVDDIFNPNWPGVAEGVFRYLLNPSSKLIPFAYGDNKLYLAASDDLEIYRSYVRHGLRPLALDYKGVEFCGWPASHLRMPAASASQGQSIDTKSEMDRRHGFLSNFDILEFTGSWHRAEASGCWTGGARSGVRVRVTGCAAKARVVGRFSAVVSPAHPQTLVTLYVNGTACAQGRFMGGQMRLELEARLETLALSDEIHVECTTDYPVSPREISMSGDRRVLGVHVQSLRFE